MLIFDYIISKLGEWVQDSNDAFSKLGLNIFLEIEDGDDRNITTYVVFLFLILLFL